MNAPSNAMSAEDNRAIRTRFLDWLSEQAGPDGIVPSLDRDAAMTALDTTAGTLGWMLWSLVDYGSLERVGRRAGPGKMPALRVTGKRFAPPAVGKKFQRAVMERRPGELSDAARDRLRREFGIEIGETVQAIGPGGWMPVTLARVPVGEAAGTPA